MYSSTGVIPTQNTSAICRITGTGSGLQASKCDQSKLIKGHVTPSNPALYA